MVLPVIVSQRAARSKNMQVSSPKDGDSAGSLSIKMNSQKNEGVTIPQATHVRVGSRPSSKLFSIPMPSSATNKNGAYPPQPAKNKGKTSGR